MSTVPGSTPGGSVFSEVRSHTAACIEPVGGLAYRGLFYASDVDTILVKGT